MTLKEITISWLDGHGADSLLHRYSGCCCTRPDIMECDSASRDCVVAKAVVIDGVTKVMPFEEALKERR